MESSLETARRVLSAHDAPALPYTELHRLVSSETPGPAPHPDDLLRRLRSRPNLFRVLDPRKGPWTSGARGHRSGSRVPAGVEPWILLVADGTSWRRAPGDPRSPWARTSKALPLSKLRETVRGLGKRADDASVLALCRWLLIATEERALRKRLPSAPGT